jgi:outer membrane lipase/esterase
LLNGIVTSPESYGLTNTRDACIVPDAEPFSCQAADDYLFWDGIHPTRAGHAVVAGAVAALIGR